MPRDGKQFQCLIRDHVRATGWPHASTPTAGSADDFGDVIGIPDVVLECKNEKRIDLAGWLNEAHLEAANAGCAIGAVVHKRRMHADPSDQYVTLDLGDFLLLCRAAGLNTPRLADLTRDAA